MYRELVGREMRAVAQWERQYGAEALLRKPDPREMQNLGKFEKFAAMPMPLEVQLRQLKQQRVEQAAEITEYERKTFPKRAIFPVSALSVSIYGARACAENPEGFGVTQRPRACTKGEGFGPTPARGDLLLPPLLRSRRPAC